MKLLFIRHGESVANTEGRLQGQMDSPLTDRGREQADALARRLVQERWPVSSIHSSDLCRAAETAGIIGAALDAPVFLDERLREYDVGVLAGLTRADIQHKYPELWRISRQSPVWPTVPGEEGNEAFGQRIASVLDHFRSTHEEGQVVAVVSHGRTLGTMLMYLLGIDLGRRTPFRFGNASLTVIEVRPHENVLACLNDMCHLNDGLPTQSQASEILSARPNLSTLGSISEVKALQQPQRELGSGLSQPPTYAILATSGPCSSEDRAVVS